IGAKVTGLRAYRRWTQEELAARANRSKRSIERAEGNELILDEVANDILGALLAGLDARGVGLAWPLFQEDVIRQELLALSGSMPVREGDYKRFFKDITSKKSFQRLLGRSDFLENLLEPTIGIGYEMLRASCPNKLSVAFAAPFVIVPAVFNLI